MRRLLLPLLAFLTICQAPAQMDPTKDFLLVGDHGYAMLPPEVVSSGEVREACFSADGAFVYAIRTNQKMSQSILDQLLKGAQPPAVGEQSIVVYNVKTQKSTEIYKLKANEGNILSLRPFATGGTAIAQISVAGKLQDGTETAFGQSAIVTPSRVTVWEQGPYVPSLFVSPNPSRPYAAVIRQNELRAQGNKATFAVSFCDPFGRLIRTVQLDNRVSPNLMWNSDGVIWLTFRSEGTDAKPVPRQWFTLDLDSGQIVPSQNRPKFTTPPDPLLKIHPGILAGQGASGQEEVPALWLTSSNDKGGVLIGSGTNGMVGEISPTLDSVLYTSQGVAMVRTIVKLPKDAVLAALKAAEKTKTLSNTKQVALALIMFISDNDDMFPGQGFDFAKELEPYTKNPGLLNGFVYTFQGGSATGIESPAETEIGYMLGPGGRAVAYADGHVKWKPDP